MSAEYRYRSPWWLPGGHLQTLWGKFARRRIEVATRCEQLTAPDGDRIELCIRREADQLVIDLTDTGVGLPEDRERLTEPYMTTRVRGTGLGLAIVKKIVGEHLGEIAFLDRSGGGTRVRIAFDADRLEALATEDPQPAAAREGDDDEYDEEDHS